MLFNLVALCLSLLFAAETEVKHRGCGCNYDGPVYPVRNPNYCPPDQLKRAALELTDVFIAAMETCTVNSLIDFYRLAETKIIHPNCQDDSCCVDNAVFATVYQSYINVNCTSYVNVVRQTPYEAYAQPDGSLHVTTILLVSDNAEFSSYFMAAETTFIYNVLRECGVGPNANCDLYPRVVIRDLRCDGYNYQDCSDCDD